MQAMKTDADRTRWAIALSGTNVMAQTDADLRRLRREMKKFLAGDPQGLAVTVHNLGPAVADLPRSDLHEIAARARAMLRAAALGDGRAGGTEVRKLVIDVVRPRGLKPELRIGGSVHDAFTMALALLLATDAGRQLQSCPECGAIFVRVRRQRYCTAKCTDRATWRNYPAEKKRVARAKQYAKQGWTLGARADAKEKKR